MVGEVHYRGLPRLRGLDPDLRARRLRAARLFAALSIPRQAIMLGHWDRGEIVRFGQRISKKRRKNNAGNQ